MHQLSHFPHTDLVFVICEELLREQQEVRRQVVHRKIRDEQVLHLRIMR